MQFTVALDRREGPVYLREGRKQLFADAYVVDELANARRVQHQPVKFSGNPVIRSEFDWESLYIQMRDAPLWNPVEKRWELRYWGRGIGVDGIGTFLAVSDDGLHWEKPVVGEFEFKGSKENNLLTPMSPYDLFLYHVLYDERDPDPQRRWKALIGDTNPRPAASPDGINWTFLSENRIPAGEEGFLIYDELSGRFVFSLRTMHDAGFGRQRAVNISTSRDFVEWTDPVLMFAADARDQELGAEWLRPNHGRSRLSPAAGQRPGAVQHPGLQHGGIPLRRHLPWHAHHVPHLGHQQAGAVGGRLFGAGPGGKPQPSGLEVRAA